MTRSIYGWGEGTGLAFRNYTHLPKVHGETPSARRAKRRHKPLPASLEVWLRDNFTCRKCNFRPSTRWSWPLGGMRTDMRELTVDHVIPASCGGSDEPHNLTTLCRACNTRRGAYYPSPRVLL